MNKPIILDFKVRRDNTKIIPFEYDSILNLCIVKNGSQTLPVIEQKLHLGETLTKTQIKGEQDDYHDYLELETKTFTKRERDDENVYLELLTKTNTFKERDDQTNENIANNSFVELLTKTKIERESDD